MFKNDEMSFLNHLEILRWHLVRSILSIILFAIIAFIMKDFVFNKVIFAPKNIDFPTYKALCYLTRLTGFEGDEMCLTEMPFVIQNRTMSGQFSSHLWVSLIVGFIVSFPYIAWEIWSFIKPGLTKKEQKYSGSTVIISSILFIIGISFGYYLIVPLSLQFLGSYQVSSEILNEIDLSSYISTISTIALASGIIFELPILVYFLTKIEILTPKIMRKYRRHSFVGILIVSAIITPPDISSQILVSVPMIVLYEISIYISSFISKKENNEIITK